MTQYNYGDEEDHGEMGGLPFAGQAPLPPGVTSWAALGVRPPPLRPLRYCEFRTGEGMCLRFASLELDTMAFCTYCHAQVAGALADEEKRIS